MIRWGCQFVDVFVYFMRYSPHRTENNISTTWSCEWQRNVLEIGKFVMTRIFREMLGLFEEPSSSRHRNDYLRFRMTSPRSEITLLDSLLSLPLRIFIVCLSITQKENAVKAKKTDYLASLKPNKLPSRACRESSVVYAAGATKSIGVGELSGHRNK